MANIKRHLEKPPSKRTRAQSKNVENSAPLQMTDNRESMPGSKSELGALARTTVHSQPMADLKPKLHLSSAKRTRAQSKNAPTVTDAIDVALPRTRDHRKSMDNTKRHLEKPPSKRTRAQSKNAKDLATDKRTLDNQKAIVSAKSQPKVGEFVFAKVRGYAAWPALIVEIEKSIIWVKFFNSTQIGKCSFGTIENLQEGVKYLNKHKQNQQFVKAAKEMAIALRLKLKKESYKCSGVIGKYMQLL